MSRAVWDASALLMVIQREPGWDSVAFDGVVVGSPNLTEVASRLIDAGLPSVETREALDALGLEIHDFTRELAFATAGLRPATRSLGLSLGDRACLALGQALGLPVLTADRAWAGLKVGVEIRLLR